MHGLHKVIGLLKFGHCHRIVYENTSGNSIERYGAYEHRRYLGIGKEVACMVVFVLLLVGIVEFIIGRTLLHLIVSAAYACFEESLHLYGKLGIKSLHLAGIGVFAALFLFLFATFGILFFITALEFILHGKVTVD